MQSQNASITVQFAKSIRPISVNGNSDLILTVYTRSYYSLQMICDSRDCSLPSLILRPSASPVFDHLQYVIKTWRCRRPGNEARVCLSTNKRGDPEGSVLQGET